MKEEKLILSQLPIGEKAYARLDQTKLEYTLVEIIEWIPVRTYLVCVSFNYKVQFGNQEFAEIEPWRVMSETDFKEMQNARATAQQQQFVVI